ncbi:MAG: PorP/SprF family type IX secretion system membrane protein [Cytophagaceae bacterium]|jgi:type IX secretion system PorP/SprF family membrane protein|nr:PorP/SprF family type IX secretion system membrane protein [Cytophagaceae bacterium]
MNQFVRILILSFVSHALWAQQFTPIAHFVNNQQVYNPAAFGMHASKLNFSTFSRLQWATIEGSPKTAHLWADYKYRNMAGGLNFSAQGYSGYSNTEINLNYAYRINISKKWTLASGMRLAWSNHAFSTDEFNIWDQQDAVISSSTYQKSQLKLGAGFHLNGRKFYAGLASADFFANNKISLEGDTAESFFKRKRNINAFMGTRIRLSDAYNLRPNIGFYYYRDNGLITQINTTFEIKDYFWAGLTFLSYGSASIQLGTHISSRLRFAYAFETQALFGVNLNTHEINLLLTMDNLFRKRKD